MVSTSSPSCTTTTTTKSASCAGRKRPLAKKTIAFASDRKERSLPATSAEEKSAVWYSANDYEAFEKDVKKTVSCIRRGRRTVVTGRGLEKYFSSQYHEEKKRREFKHYRSILREQHRQRAQGEEPNPKLFRMLSVVNSKWALEKALNLANHDASEVLKEAQQDAPSSSAPETTAASAAAGAASDSESSAGEYSLDLTASSI